MEGRSTPRRVAVHMPKKDVLTFDIWHLVFKEIWIEATTIGNYWKTDCIEDDLRLWLQNLRTVSKDFNKIITPHVHHTVRISESHIIRDDPENIYRLFKANVLLFSNKIILTPSRNVLVLSEMVQIVSASRKLVTTRWDLKGNDINAMSRCISNSLQEIMKRAVHCSIDYRDKCFYIEEVGQNGIPIERKSSYTNSQLAQQILPSTSISETGEEESSTIQTLTLKDACLNWESESKKILYNPMFQRILPMTELSLTVEGSDLYCFLKTIPAEDLKDLYTFEIVSDEHNWDIQGSKAPLVKLFGKFERLENLKFNHERWQELLPPSSICRLGANLKRLELRDMTWQDVPLTVQELDHIRVHCPDLLFLAVNWASDSGEKQNFLEILCRFEHVCELVLVTSNGVQLSNSNQRSTDPDDDGATIIFDFMRKNKYGIPITSCMVEVERALHVRATGEYEDGFMLDGIRVFKFSVRASGHTERSGDVRFDTFAVSGDGEDGDNLANEEDLDEDMDGVEGDESEADETEGDEEDSDEEDEDAVDSINF
ncbi:uncharacterized protein LY89DRAFT_732264 [Mollisia scopiformis]|uniref:Uncharacterized protein n=1 Tax=Mollisia scopiformis TaxID=149040 RepID=A0A194XEY5_MOLSC|nr:uncharacterized protein LY89DRAFT_732264 [Mollisia scopiformis]KUJ18711.1 hypothetical protein LY89DRAFT_732264 [Mollisia scopiformis]